MLIVEVIKGPERNFPAGWEENTRVFGQRIESNAIQYNENDGLPLVSARCYDMVGILDGVLGFDQLAMINHRFEYR